MPRVSSVTPAQWKALVTSFREQPDNIRAAAQKAGVKWVKARQAWERGFPAMDPPKPSIRAMMDQEATDKAAREAIIRTETEAFAATLRGDVRAEALDQYQRTTIMVKNATITANNALSAVAKLNQVASDLAALAPKLTEKIKAAVEQDELDPVQALIALEKISGFAHKVTATSNAATSQGAKAVEVERLMKGDATSIIGVKETLAEPVSADEAKRLAAELAEAAQEAEAAASGQPDLKVLPGGAPVAQTA